MTLEEVQIKIELGIEQSQVTMEGDGCNCSAIVVSPIFEGLSLLQDKEQYFQLLVKKLRAENCMH